MRLVVEEARSKADRTPLTVGKITYLNTHEIVSDDRCFAYEIIFDQYVAYSVRDESYADLDEYEETTGRLACIYTKSRFLDYVRAGTIANDDYPGPITHYGFMCLNHIVDVAALEAPEIRIIRNPSR